MNNLERAVEFYARTSGRYARRRPHGIREPVLAWQRKGIVELAAPRTTDSVLDVGCALSPRAVACAAPLFAGCREEASQSCCSLDARAPGRTAARSATARIRAQSRPSGPRTRS